jgi:heat-inducible transcriptional repressor
MQEQHFNSAIDINERAQKILKLLIDCYIREGQPVSSKVLAQTSELNISAASVRNIMADLEDAGLIHAPHTSAGRVPTIKGYRFFVNDLINVQSLPELSEIDFEDKLRSCANTKEIITAASSLLSDMTHLTSLVMLPCRESVVLRHIEFLPLSDNRVLVILVLYKGEVQNRIIYTDRCYSSSELQTIGNYLTANFAGKELNEIRQLLFAAMENDQAQIAHLTQAIIDMTSQVFAKSANENPDYVLAGKTNLLAAQDQVTIHKLRDLFAAFEAKRDILHLLGQCLRADGVRIYIGEESGYAPLNDCSLVMSPYSEGDKVVGVVGVIGPTRMAYDKVLAAVDVTARLLGVALNELA